METANNNTERNHPKEERPGENADNEHAKGTHTTVQDKPDEERVKTVTPDNDSGAPGPPADKASK